MILFMSNVINLDEKRREKNMEKFMKEYGKYVIPGIAVALVIAFLCTKKGKQVVKDVFPAIPEV